MSSKRKKSVFQSKKSLIFKSITPNITHSTSGNRFELTTPRSAPATSRTSNWNFEADFDVSSTVEKLKPSDISRRLPKLQPNLVSTDAIIENDEETVIPASQIISDDDDEDNASENSQPTSPVLPLTVSDAKRPRYLSPKPIFHLPDPPAFTSAARVLSFDDPADQCSGRDEIVQILTSESETEESSAKTSKPVAQTEKEVLTAAEWLKTIEAKKNPVALIKQDAREASQGSASISTASSPSQPNLLSLVIDQADDLPEDSLLNSGKKKKPTKFGLAAKFDAVMRKANSSRTLRLHMLNKNEEVQRLTNKKVGEIVSIEKITKNLCYLTCVQKTSVQLSNYSRPFKVILNKKLNEDIFEKLIIGKTISILGPWCCINVECDGVTLQVYSNFDRITLVETSS